MEIRFETFKDCSSFVTIHFIEKRQKNEKESIFIFYIDFVHLNFMLKNKIIFAHIHHVNLYVGKNLRIFLAKAKATDCIITSYIYGGELPNMNETFLSHMLKPAMSE